MTDRDDEWNDYLRACYLRCMRRPSGMRVVARVAVCVAIAEDLVRDGLAVEVSSPSPSLRVYEARR